MPEQSALFVDGELAEAPERICTEALEIWNAVAPTAGWPGARFLTQSRRVALRRAVRDYGGLAGWKTHLAAASRNDFLNGKASRKPGHENWRPDIDWFLKPANVLKVLEGRWPANSAAPGEKALAQPRTVDWRGRLDKYKPGGFWHEPSEGPRPERFGVQHQAPADMIAQWRERYGIVEPAQVSREERMASSIVSLRKYGKYGEANRVEEQLARLQGRPPVLVPAPEVAHMDSTTPRPSVAPRRDTSAAIDIEPDYGGMIPEGDYATEEEDD